MERQTLFEAGTGGCASYRIPTVITLPTGRVIAFCEARVHSSSDCGVIYIVARISEDGGRSFGPQFPVARDGDHTVGNPSPIYDRETGVLHLLLNGSRRDGDEAKVLRGEAPRTVLSVCSGDGGRTWEPLWDLTASVKQPDWGWYAMGPCHGLQLQSGRLLSGCNHSILGVDGVQAYRSHAIYSDDHGKTWKTGASLPPATNECAAAELEDGRVYLSMRNWLGHDGQGFRAAAWSRDGGQSWEEFRVEEGLPDPGCQGTVLSVRNFAGKPGVTLLLSNAAHPSQRKNLTLRCSGDGGRTWSAGRVIQPGFAAYSDLTALPDGSVGCLFECGEAEGPYERIDWAVLEPEELNG